MFNVVDNYQIRRDQSREYPKGTSFRALSAEDMQLNCSTSEALNAESWNPVLTQWMELCSIRVPKVEIRNV